MYSVFLYYSLLKLNKMSNGSTTDLPKKSQLEKNVEILLNKVYEAEKDLRNRANYCNDHNFPKDEEWLICGF